MREVLNKYGKIIAPVALVLAVGIWYLVSRGGGSSLPKSALFMDEDTGQEVLRPISDVPPITGAKGTPSIVKVYKYSCDGGKTTNIGYYIKFTPEMKSKLEEVARNPNAGTDLVATTGMLVRGPQSKSSDWVPASSSAGQKIMDIQCDSGNPETIYP